MVDNQIENPNTQLDRKETLKLKTVFEKSIEFFKTKNISSARLDAEILLSECLQMKRIDIYLNFERPLSDQEIAMARSMVARRGRGEPVAYIIGKKYFYKHEFFIEPSVLVPRPETELILDLVNGFMPNYDSELKVLDLGVGSGCLGLSILDDFKNSYLHGIDVSELAIKLSQKNAEKLQLESRAVFYTIDLNSANAQQDLDQLLAPNFDVIVSNPPYIAEGDANIDASVALYEPNIALYAKENGYLCLKNWSRLITNKLNKRSICIMEIGKDQGPEMKSFYERMEVFDKVYIAQDLASYDRFIVGEKLG